MKWSAFAHCQQGSGGNRHADRLMVALQIVTTMMMVLKDVYKFSNTPSFKR